MLRALASLAIAATLAVSCASLETGPDHPDWEGDDSAYWACDDLGKWVNDGEPVSDRLERFEGVNKWAHRSDTERVPMLGEQLVASAVSGDQAMIALAVEGFAGRCLELGYAKANAGG